MRRLIRLEVHVAANLVHNSVAPLSTECGHKLRTAQITWQLHPGFLLRSVKQRFLLSRLVGPASRRSWGQPFMAAAAFPGGAPSGAGDLVACQVLSHNCYAEADDQAARPSPQFELARAVIQARAKAGLTQAQLARRM
jgi:hypothetical protein